MVLVPGGVGHVQDALVEDLGGLGPHAAQNTKALFRHFTFSMELGIPLLVAALVLDDAQLVDQVVVRPVEQGIDRGIVPFQGVHLLVVPLDSRSRRPPWGMTHHIWRFWVTVKGRTCAR